MFIHCLIKYTRTKKKYQLTFTDSLKVFNVMLHSFFLNKLTKFHSIFSDDYEKNKEILIWLMFFIPGQA